MTRRMYRYQVVVGGQPKDFELTGNPLYVEARTIGVGPNAQHLVDFWAEYNDAPGPTVTRTFQAFGTGMELPADARYWGTTARTDDGLVWHLYELGRGRFA